MRKIYCILLALILVFTAITAVSATEAPAQEVPVTSTIPVTEFSENEVMPRYLVGNFPQLAPNEQKILGECTVKKGVTKLHIESCTWYPANTIRIGFSDVNTGTEYFVAFDGGMINNFNITTENVPSGSYHLFVRNKGTSGIGSGTLYYELLN